MACAPISTVRLVPACTVAVARGSEAVSPLYQITVLALAVSA
ncbi:hypothetical protein M2437_000768 [Methylorubrum pseudosasae]|nr:hypothetical protein [Methylorubrum pseudosasae]